MLPVQVSITEAPGPTTSGGARSTGTWLLRQVVSDRTIREDPRRQGPGGPGGPLCARRPTVPA